jgi:hypothetical protein
VLDEWDDTTARDLRVRAMFLDYYDASNIDEVNWTLVTAYLYGNNKTHFYEFVYNYTNETGIYNVTRVHANDSMGSLNTTDQINLNFTVGANNAPEVSAGPVISPANPNQFDNLTCAFTITDSDVGDTLYANWTWLNWTGSSWEAKFKGRKQVADGVQNSVNLSSGNTTYGDRWNCSILPWDETVYGTELSDAVSINNTPPPAVNLSYPPKVDNFFTDRWPAFNWTAVTDPDGDSITYHFQLAYDYDFASLVVDNGTLNTNLYNYTDHLQLSTQYFWRVLANDSLNESPWSAIWNFTVQPYIALAITNASMEFSNMFFGESDDTTDQDPGPFKLRNDGNTEANVTMWGTQIWEQASLDTEYYQYKARELEADAYNASKSQTAFTNVTAGNSTLLCLFNYTDSKDEAYVDIKLTVPLYESPGYKSSSVTFFGEEPP